jgi:oligopeptide/dipeptide ABC transporter ATP-binding protein
MNSALLPPPLLEVQNLQVRFPVSLGIWGKSRTLVRAVDGVSFRLFAGETLGLVGESGCGKTTLGRAVVRLVEPNAGRILFAGEDLSECTAAELRARRSRFQMIFQDPYTSLDPRLTISEIVAEGLEIKGVGRSQRRQQALELLRAVGLDPAQAQQYPHEFSGGQRQRIGVARALAVEPKLLVCDEPVSALDVSVQAQILNLLQDLQRERRLACLFISHDLAVVEHMSRHVMVMYLGKIVESGEASTVVRLPSHPYTQALISAAPTLAPGSRRRRLVLPGDVDRPLSINPSNGCPFHPRCPVAKFPLCRTEIPVLREISPGHQVACHLASPQPAEDNQLRHKQSGSS